MRARWALLLAAASASVHAGALEWHVALAGVPLTQFGLRTAPAVHPAGVIVTATQSNVLAGIHPDNGTLAWRYPFAGGPDQVVSVHRHEQVIAALSGPGGATLRVFAPGSGALLLEKALHAPEAGRLEAPDRGAAVAFVDRAGRDRPDLLVLTNGHEVRRLTPAGELEWAWTASDQTGQILYTHVLPQPDAIYVLGVSKSFASLQLAFVALDPASGALLSSTLVPSSVADGVRDVIPLGGCGGAAHVAFVESGALRSVALTPDGVKAKPETLRGVAVERVADVGLGEDGLLVGIHPDGSGQIVSLNANCKLTAGWEFVDSARNDAYTDSLYTGGRDPAGRPYVARVYWSHAHAVLSAHVYAPHLARGAGVLSGFTLPFDPARHGAVLHAALDVSNTPEEETVPADPGSAGAEAGRELGIDARLLLTTSTGAVQMWAKGRAPWTREESLASASAQLVLDLPAPAASAPAHATSFAARLLRHAAQLQNLPAYVAAFVQRPAALDAPPADTGRLERDAFGTRKLLLLATPAGAVFALDGASGRVVWQKPLGLGWAGRVDGGGGARVLPTKLFELKNASTGAPEAALVAVRRGPTGLVDTLVYHFDALTGASIMPALGAGVHVEGAVEERDDVLAGIDIVQAAVVDSWALELAGQQVLVLADEYQNTHLYPTSAAIQAAFAARAPGLSFALRVGAPGARKLAGHGFMARADAETGAFRAFQAWTFSPPAGVDVRALVPSSGAALASLGRVRGNRSTTYKFAHGRMLAVVLAGARPPSCELAVLDGGKGSVLYRRALPAGAGAGCDVKVALAENWLVAHYWDEDARPFGAKGWRLLSAEFFEGGLDETIGSPELSAYSAEQTKVRVEEQTFVYAHDVSALALSATKHGISSIALLAAHANGQVVSVPRRALDPRRPKRAATPEEAEEGLVAYDAVLPDDARRVLSRGAHVLRVARLATRPALLESTAVVLASGLDLFCARLAPSGAFDVLAPEFNKAQLVLTVAALAAGIGAVRPMVRRRALRERWYV